MNHCLILIPTEEEKTSSFEIFGNSHSGKRGNTSRSRESVPDPDTSRRRGGKKTTAHPSHILTDAFLLEGEISTLTMTYIQLLSRGWGSSSFLTEIVLVGLEEFARLVGERLGREGER